MYFSNYGYYLSHLHVLSWLLLNKGYVMDSKDCCRRLFQAVILQAIKDAASQPFSRYRGGKNLAYVDQRKNARSFLFGKGCQNYCELLNIDYNWFCDRLRSKYPELKA